MEARQGRDSRSEARCAARQRDGGTPGRPTAWDRTTRCPSCAARFATAPVALPVAAAPPARPRRQGGQILGNVDAGLVQLQQFDLLALLAGAKDDPERRGFLRLPFVLV